MGPSPGGRDMRSRDKEKKRKGGITSPPSAQICGGGENFEYV